MTDQPPPTFASTRLLATLYGAEPAARPAERNIAINGLDVTLFGHEADPYFANLTLADHTNDFLAWVCKHQLPTDATVFDVGANIGLTTAMFALTARAGRVYSFEPSPTAYPFLTQMLRRNTGMDRCCAFNIAIGPRPGRAAFSDNDQSASASHLSDGALGCSNAQVEIVPLDQFVSDHNIDRVDLIKIDVEGFEMGVIAGAAQLLSKLRPQVFLEFNSFTLIAYGNENPRRFLELLLLVFPHVYRFDGGQPIEIRTPDDVLTFLHDNLIKRGCVDDLYCRYSPIGTVPDSVR